MIWDDIIPAEEQRIYLKAGYPFDKKRGFGEKPAVLVVDACYAFVGDRPEPILESMNRFPNSCGEAGWQGICNIQRLLQSARESNAPIIYIVPQYPERGPGSRLTATKADRPPMNAETAKFMFSIPKEIEPYANDIVVRKQKASAFFGTNLVGYLISLGVNTLLITGCTTSGCVRATVTDAFSHEYRVAVIEECVWDRSQTSHKVNLFEMSAKFADIVTLAEVQSYLERFR